MNAASRVSLDIPEGCGEFPFPGGNPRGFCGEVEGVTLADMVQLACLSGDSRVLSIRSPKGRGEIFFDKGEVMHAAFEGKVGEEAFYQLMAIKGGKIALRPGSVRERTVTTPWNFLIIEALRQTDEMTTGRNAASKRPITALIVDDSPVAGSALEKILRDFPDMADVIRAGDGRAALAAMEERRPDLVTLDLNMPVMGGEAALKHIMIRSPAPVVLVSGLDPMHFYRVMDFMRLGAVDFIPKPRDRDGWKDVKNRLASVVSGVSEFRLSNVRRARVPQPVKVKERPGLPAERILVLIGGAGGLLEIQMILPALAGVGDSSILYLQDVAYGVVDPLAHFLDSVSPIAVSALHSDYPLLGAQCWVADWSSPWKIVSDGEGSAIQRAGMGGLPLDADLLLASAAEAFGERVMVFVLSGATIEMLAGIEAVVSRRGRVILQEPSRALSPGPIKRLMAQELEEACVHPEEGAGLIREWFSARG